MEPVIANELGPRRCELIELPALILICFMCHGGLSVCRTCVEGLRNLVSIAHIVSTGYYIISESLKNNCYGTVLVYLLGGILGERAIRGNAPREPDFRADPGLLPWESWRSRWELAEAGAGQPVHVKKLGDGRISLQDIQRVMLEMSFIPVSWKWAGRDRSSSSSLSTGVTASVSIIYHQSR